MLSTRQLKGFIPNPFLLPYLPKIGILKIYLLWIKIAKNRNIMSLAAKIFYRSQLNSLLLIVLRLIDLCCNYNSI